MPRSVFGDAFDLVVVINLDRRTDRMSRVRAQLSRLGLKYERFSAIDGKSPETIAEWQTYTKGQVTRSSEMRRVENWRDFYLGDKPHGARVAFYENARGAPAISTAGAWGLFGSMRRVIERAVKERVARLLILEDDVIFHRDTVDLWPRVATELPADWQILQLGAMQLHWEDDWIQWHSQHLYKCQGSSIAAHAVALKQDAMRAILARATSPDLPFDIGPLQEAKRVLRDRCYTAYPNLAIQDASDTEIGMSDLFAREAAKQNNIYRWDWSAYGPDVLRPFVPLNAEKIRQNPSAQPDHARKYFLQPYSAAPDGADRILVLFGPADEQDAMAYVTLLKSQKETGDIAPILVIDTLSHIDLLRGADLAFEYVPQTASYAQALPEDRDPELVVLRRLSILRRKWLPRRIMALGERAQARLSAWRASPFERASVGSDLAADLKRSGLRE